MSPRHTHPLVTALIALTLLAGCGKSISITDSDDSADNAADQAPASTTPQAGQAQSNAGLEVIGNSAEESGLNGDGGTVTGAQPQAAPPEWAQLTAVQAAPVQGARLVDVNQSSLYRFDEDTANPSTSTCFGQCAQNWPPVIVERGGRIYLQGVDPQAVGAIQREDGTIQLTAGGWPLYRFAGDNEPGELNGQGNNGTWFAVSPTGQKVQ
jgi:predicted lipoprotein with Yx(FWY)xxD motif